MILIADNGFQAFSHDDWFYYIHRNESNHHDYFYKTDLNHTIEIMLDEFAVAKFGKSWRAVHSVYTNCIRLQNGEYLTCHFEGSDIFLHDIDGKKKGQVKIPSLKTGFGAIDSIALDADNRVWVAQSSEHSISQNDFRTEHQFFKIGGEFDNPGLLSYPEEIIVYDGFLFISDTGNKRVCKLDIETKELSDHLEFDEPASQYIRFKNKELVVLQSGIYVV